MTAEKKFVPVMITPFDLKAKIDFDSVSRLIDFYLEAGVKGFFANCLSSEMFSLSEDERLALTRHVVRYVDGRVPVVATGSFGLTVDDKAEFTKKIYHTGIDAVILITGHYANVEDGDDVLLKRFARMFTLTDNIPLGLYECPMPYKRILPPATLQTLLTSNRFVYYKDTTRSVEAVKDKLEAMKSSVNKRFEFYDAHSPNGVWSLQAGAKGLSSIAGNFYPEIMVWLCNNATDAARAEDVQWLQGEISRVDPVIHDAYPMSAKYFLKKRGLPVRTISRAYTLELTPTQKQVLDKVHEDFLSWCDRLSITPVNAAEVDGVSGRKATVPFDPPI